MPITDGVFSRIWKFVDRFTTSDVVARADLDAALDDVAGGINGAVTFLQGEIASSVSPSLYLGRLSAEPATNDLGGPLVEGNSYILASTDVAYVYDGTSWQKVGDLPFASGLFKGLVGLETEAEFRAAIGLGTAATASLSTLATANQVNAEAALSRALRQIHVTGGLANDFSIVTNTPIQGYASWQAFLVRFNRPPTGAATLNVDNLGARPLMTMGAGGTLGDISAGEWAAGDHFFVVYDGSKFVLLKNYAASPLDEDDFASNSATLPPTQRSVGAYVAGQIEAAGWQGAAPISTPSGVSFDVTGVSADVDEIELLFDGVSLSGSDSILVQVGAGAISTSGYTSFSNRDGALNLTASDGFIVALGFAALANTGRMVLSRLDGNLWVADHTGATFGVDRAVTGSGRVALQGPLDRIRITRTGADTFDGGQIKVRWRARGDFSVPPPEQTLTPELFSGTDREKIQALIDSIGDVSVTDAAGLAALPVYSIDLRGRSYTIDGPIIIGSVPGKTSGFFRGLRIDNGKITADAGGDWSDIAPDVPGSMFVVADHKLTDNDPATTRLHNIVFGENLTLDCAYATGGIFFENAHYCAVRSDIDDIGIGRWAVQTSVGDKTQNARGVLTNCTELRISNRVHDNTLGRTPPLAFDGIAAEQTATAAGPLLINGAEAAGGEWVSPTGAAEIITIRSTWAYVDGGANVQVTITGFADTARTQALSETITLRRNSTAFQVTRGVNRFAVITGVTTNGNAGDKLAVDASMENGGYLIEVPDVFISQCAVGWLDYALILRGNGHAQISDFHPYSKEIILDRLNFGVNAQNIFADFTDIRVILGAASPPINLGSLVFNSDTRVILVATAANSDGKAISLGPFHTQAGRTRPVIDLEEQGGTWVAPEQIKAAIAPGAHNTQGPVPILRAGPDGEFTVDDGGFIRLANGKATGGGPVATIRNNGDDLQIVPTDGAGGVNFDNELRWRDADGEWNVGAKFPGATPGGVAVYGPLRLPNPLTPAGTLAAGSTGQIAWDDSNIYVRTSTGWMRAQLFDLSASASSATVVSETAETITLEIT